jgi:hypothetical protein
LIDVATMRFSRQNQSPPVHNLSRVSRSEQWTDASHEFATGGRLLRQGSLGQ